MSSSNPLEKKRRLQNACDSCKRRKVKCDSAKMDDKVCSNCRSLGIECTHTEPIKRRGPKNRYVEQLEQRVGKMETLLKQSQSQDPRGSSIASNYSSSSATSTPIAYDANLRRTSGNIVDKFNNMNFSESARGRYFGASSGIILAQTALQTKKDIIGHHTPEPFGCPRQMWEMLPWELETQMQEIPQYSYPPDDLIAKLVDTYFAKVNVGFPILHEPSFRKNLEDGLHHHNYHFGGTVLLVCAAGSRYLQDDPRIFLDGSQSELSCGWKWYDQVRLVRKTQFIPATLFDLQNCCLLIFYIYGTTAPHAAFIYVALGLRQCQELGLHRKKPDGYKRTIEDEQFIRCFWVLIAMDRFTSTFSGRPVALAEDEFDTNYPFECDDIYWDNPDPAKMFVQPSGTPSTVAFFIGHLKICEILSMAMRTLYSSRQPTGQAAQDAVLRIDSSLNEWLDQVPKHLRWNPNQENHLFFVQSAILYTIYYLVQIQTHRPFIHTPSPLTLSSLAMCANAARSCSHVIEAQMDRDVQIYPHVYMAAFISGTVLLINIWGGHSPGAPRIYSRRDLADVDRCLRYLRAASTRWALGTYLTNMLFSLADGCSEDHDVDRAESKSIFPKHPSPSKDVSRLEENWKMQTDLPLNSTQLQQMPIYRNSPPSAPLTPTLSLDNDTGIMDGTVGGDMIINEDFLRQLNAQPGYAPQLDDTAMTIETMTNNTINFWSDAPAGFNLAEWGMFLGSIDTSQSVYGS